MGIKDFFKKVAKKKKELDNYLDTRAEKNYERTLKEIKREKARLKLDRLKAQRQKLGGGSNPFLNMASAGLGDFNKSTGNNSGWDPLVEHY